MMTQRNAVFAAVCKVMGDVEGTKVTCSKDQLKQIHQEVLVLFQTGQVELKDADKRDTEWLKKYIPGLTNNWLRKDVRINGGQKYETKNPGIRQGSGDDQLRQMKNLLKVLDDPEAKKAVEAEIAARQEQLAEAKRPVIDVTKLPEHLRHLVPAPKS